MLLKAEEGVVNGDIRPNPNSLLPPQGFGPEAKTRGGIIETPA